MYIPWKLRLKQSLKVKLTVYILSFFPGRYSLEFLVEMCRSVLQILTLFQAKKCHFSHLF